MKIGILTFHNAINCGAVFQAYALKEAVKTIEKDVEIIDYKQPFVLRPYKIVNIVYKPLSELPKSIVSNSIYLATRIIKYMKFSKFFKNHLHLTGKTFINPKEISGKDVYVVGSDQVWNPSITRFDEAYFLNFARKGEKKVAYAASMGKDVLSEEELGFVKKNIESFDFISVRERSGLEILKSLTDKEITQTLDPTLLFDESLWDKFVRPIKMQDKYLLVYRLTDNEEVYKIAKEVASRLGLKVFNINDSILPNPYGFKNIRKVGPEEFLTLFKNASFVVTNSFHGTAFSIVFQKNFLTVPHETRGTRMVSLLSLLTLECRLIKRSLDLSSKKDFNIDYGVPNQLLDKERQKSLIFLVNALTN